MPELWRKAHERGFPLDIRPQVQPPPCSSVADGSYILDAFGEVYKCWELVGLKEHMVGKINLDGDLEKTLVYGDVLERNPLNIEQCRKDAYLPACGGGCVCKAQWQSKTYHAPGCGTEKYLLKDKVK
ncbi:SPASM domain-containing protein, partial [Candidatus Woesearchaeota archaeon]|nr:SPASM domain-containing protein [Candidatus Woesearchaeota archaeon]